LRIDWTGPVRLLDPDAAFAVMFVVSEADTAATRTAGSPGITDNEQARDAARAIAGWQPLPVKPTPVSSRRRARPA
jgi:hypothetical protein